MDEKTFSTEFLVKSANLCRFLCEEKGEKLFSKKLFDSSSSLCEAISSFKNPSLTKPELSSLKKSASLDCDRITLYLSCLNQSLYISSAQQDSMLRSLENIKKQFNI